jgi:hypothetical protein
VVRTVRNCRFVPAGVPWSEPSTKVEGRRVHSLPHPHFGQPASRSPLSTAAHRGHFGPVVEVFARGRLSSSTSAQAVILGPTTPVLRKKNQAHNRPTPLTTVPMMPAMIRGGSPVIHASPSAERTPRMMHNTINARQCLMEQIPACDSSRIQDSRGQA